MITTRQGPHQRPTQPLGAVMISDRVAEPFLERGEY